MDLLIFLVNNFLKESKSMTARTIINIFYNNEQKITNERGCEEQIWGFKEQQLEKQQLDSHKKLIIY